MRLGLPRLVTTVKNRNDLMLLRIAQGDAYALPYEYVKDEDAPGLKQELLKLERYHRHPTYHNMGAGTYTDDTQMSIAVAEVLWENAQGTMNGYMSTETFMRRFFEAFKRDPRDGYSRQLQRILEGSKTFEEFVETLVPCSNANGAAMRAVPIGVISDPEQVVKVATLQAAGTHSTPGGVDSAVTVALMSHFALHSTRDLTEVLEWGSQYCSAFEGFHEPWEGRVKARDDVPGDPGVGMNTAHAAHTLLTQERTLKGIMRQVIEWGGDTDSVASIAWGIASCRCQDEVLPSFLEDDLERSVGSDYGPQFLKDLGKRLMESYA